MLVRGGFWVVLGGVSLVAAMGGAVCIPLDPATLADADVFIRADSWMTRAAQQAGLAFISAPAPQPPQVLLTFAPPGARVGPGAVDSAAPGSVGKRSRSPRSAGGLLSGPTSSPHASAPGGLELLVWRGDMLPDQMAPGEIGTLFQKRQQADGSWTTVQARADFELVAHPVLVPQPPPPPLRDLPAMIIETPYLLGTIGGQPVTLLLWRTPEEGRAPLGGAVQLSVPPSKLVSALQARVPPFPEQAGWAAEFSLRRP